MKVCVATNGCEEAQLSSRQVEQFFRKNDLTITDDPTQADLVVFYACGLTNQSEKDSLIVIKKLKAMIKPTGKLLIWGCLPKISPQSIAMLSDVPTIGALDTYLFNEVLENPKVKFDDVTANTLCPRLTSGLYDQRYSDTLGNALLLFRKGIYKLQHLQDRQIEREPFYIRVATGCTGNCTYCSEKSVFGGIRSRPIEKIVSEFNRGIQKGYKCFFLAAEDLGAYGKDIGCTLLDLFEKMKIDDERKYKLVLNQVHPLHLKKLSSDLEEVFASGKVESLCSPVQSGSNRILKLMRRPYTAEEWSNCMLKINKKFPTIRLKTHFMVGFPGETNEDFNATLRLLDFPLFIDSMGIFKFSARPEVWTSRTSKLISEEIKESRCNKLLRKYAYMYMFNTAIRTILPSR